MGKKITFFRVAGGTELAIVPANSSGTPEQALGQLGPLSALALTERAISEFKSTIEVDLLPSGTEAMIIRLRPDDTFDLVCFIRDDSGAVDEFTRSIDRPFDAKSMIIIPAHLAHTGQA